MMHAHACCKDLNGKLIRHKVMVDAQHMNDAIMNNQAFTCARKILKDRGYNIADDAKVFFSFG